MRCFRFSLVLTCLLATSHWPLATARAGDWPNWRGPTQNGVSPETDLPDKFSLDPNAPDSHLLWKAPYGSRSAPIVLNGRVYLINDAGKGVTEQERVLCLDADTGKLLWEHRFNVFHTDIVSDRVGWTNLAGDPETGNIYAHGVQGMLFCFDKDGKVLWSHSLTEEFGRISGYGGRVVSPLVYGDLVIVSMLNASWGDQAPGRTRFVAFDKKTGDVVWWSASEMLPKDTYYSYPVVADIDGQKLVISGGGDGGVHAIKLNTGQRVWSYPLGTGAVNCSAVVDGNRIYIAHAEENPDNNIKGRVVCLDAADVKDGKPKLLWKKDGLRIKFASPILHDGRLYVADENANLSCLDAATGRPIWRKKYGRNCMGSPILADGKIYVGEVNSHFHILKPGEKKCEELHDQSFPGVNGVDVELNGTPAIANGRVYFTTSNETYCLGKKNHQPAANAAAPGQAKPADAGEPAFLQVLPADVVLSPGDSKTFKLRAFDAKGNFVKEVQADQWLLPAPPPPPMSNLKPPALRGQVKDGKFTAAKEVPAQQGVVVAKLGALTGSARVRIAPRLPYKQDFEKVPVGAPIGGWVNCAGKFAVAEKDGSKVLKKLATNPSPLVARANAFIGMPNLTDYTIQCDVNAGRVRNDMSDVGIIANRYTLMLSGNTQRLRLISWDALPRVDKTIAFSWKPDIWYTMKLSVEVGKDKSVVKGKVWERGQSEPADWSVEFVDPVPNREGSPALYGFAAGILDQKNPGAEIFYDNLSITPNNRAARAKP